MYEKNLFKNAFHLLTKQLYVSSPRAPEKKVIFITGRFRSGTTLLWNLFRNIEIFTAYYEPFNKLRFNKSARGQIDPTHLNVKEQYFLEYEKNGIPNYTFNPKWDNQGLYMDETHKDSGMKRYLEILIKKSPKHVVMKFNRLDFRLGWARANFPHAKLFHIYRNPRDQWYSTLRDFKKRVDKTTNIKDIEDTNHDALFYLLSWRNDLINFFPVLNDKAIAHPYEVSYLLSKLSYQNAVEYADLSISFEDLVIHWENIMMMMLEKVQLDADLIQVKKLASVVSSESAAPKWMAFADDKWFTEKEKKCDLLLNEFGTQA